MYTILLSHDAKDFLLQSGSELEEERFSIPGGKLVSSSKNKQVRMTEYQNSLRSPMIGR